LDLPKRLIFKGHVRLINSKLTGYDLASKLSEITSFSGITVGKENRYPGVLLRCAASPHWQQDG
jgi:hypothetical protein